MFKQAPPCVLVTQRGSCPASRTMALSVWQSTQNSFPLDQTGNWLGFEHVASSSTMYVFSQLGPGSGTGGEKGPFVSLFQSPCARFSSDAVSFEFTFECSAIIMIAAMTRTPLIIPKFCLLRITWAEACSRSSSSDLSAWGC